MTTSADEYNGWPNRETWATHLHLTNSEYWYDQVEGAVIAGTEECHAWLLDHGFGGIPTPQHRIADKLHAILEDYLDPEIVGVEDALNGYRDIGSVWRVDFVELARNLMDSFDRDNS